MQESEALRFRTSVRRDFQTLNQRIQEPQAIEEAELRKAIARFFSEDCMSWSSMDLGKSFAAFLVLALGGWLLFK